MSLSKCYTSTPETTNTARLARLILGPCTDVLREILKTEVLPSDLSRKVKEFTNKLPNRQRNPLNKKQSETIFPKQTEQYSGDYSDLDISLLYLLLRNVSKIAPHSKGWGEIPNPGDRSVAANIERIRLLRNQYYGHAADLSQSEPEFRQEWRNIRDIVVELERHLGTTTVFQDAVKEIKTCTMDPEQEKKYINLLGDVRELHKTVDNLPDKMKSMLPHDPRVARMIDTTKQVIEKHFEALRLLFVKTRAFDRVKELLDNQGYVVIKGNPGTGKTTIAKMLMKELMEEGNSPLQLYKLTDLYENISVGDGIVVFIDNLFGEFSLQKDAIQEFKSLKEIVKVLFEFDNNESNRLILTIRNDIYQEYVQNEGEDDFLMSSLVDLSSKENTLLKKEIIQLSGKYKLYKQIEDEDLINKVYGIPLSIGFPQCCKLARGNEDFRQNVFKQRVSAFIPNPMMFLKDYFKTLMKSRTAKTAILVYLLLRGGKVDLELMNNPHMDLEMKRASLEFVGIQSSYINDFQESITCFEGFLLIYDTIENTYKFSHSSVHEAVFAVLFKFDPEKMIQTCHPSLLLTLTTCKNPKSTQVFMEHRLFKYVVHRIANVIEERSVIGFSSISSLELWNDSNFHEHVLQTEHCTSIFKTYLDKKGDAMIVHFSKVGNKRWVEYLLPNSVKRQRYRSINAACSKNQPDIVNLILLSGVECDLQTCFNAVQSGNIELLLRVCEFVDVHQISSSLHPVWSCLRHSLLQEICFMQQTQLIEQVLEKYPFLVDIKNDQGSNALQSAASSGDKHAFNFLLKFGCDPIEKDRDNGHTVLTCACQEGRLNMVKYLVEKYPALLKEHKDIHGGSLLYWAAFSGKIDMFEYMFHLFQNENILHISSDIKHMVYAKDNSGQSILHAACSYGHFDMCEYLLKRYPELLNICDNDGKNVLHYAAQGGNVNIFKYLLSKGLNVNCTTNTGQTVLHKCCSEGREDMCRYLVNRYPSLITVIDNKGLTVLDSACRGGSVAIVSFLIEKEMDIHTLSNEGRSILHRVCLNGKYEICEYLVQKYPHLLDVRDRCSNTELHAAAWGGNVQIIKLLIEKKMDINTLREDGETVLHICCRSGKIEMCEYLVKHYSDLLEIRDSKGWTVLHSACCGGRVEMVFYLIKNKLDLDSLSNNGESILHIACIKGKIEVCEFLIKNYPSLLDGRDKNNNSVLHYAVFGGNVEIVKLLIENKMDKYTREEVGETNLRQCCRSSKKKFCESDNFSALIEIRNSDGLTVLHSACHIGSVQIFSLLLEKGMDINVLSNGGKSVMHIACLNGKLDICKYLVENYPHLLDVRDKYSNTVLHDAAWGGNVQIVKLIEKKLDRNAQEVDVDGKTILHKCCRSGKMEMCKYVVNHFSDLLEITDNKGWTVLHSACCGGRLNILLFLIEKRVGLNGMDINAVSKDGKSILHIACLYGKFEICEHLVENYPHLLNVRDKCSNSVLPDAVLGGNVQIVKLLIKNKMDIKTLLKESKTILHQCCRSGKIEMCEYLVNNFRELLEIRDNYGLTVLHSACKRGNVAIVSFLIQKGLDINALATDGENILYVACFYQMFEICKFLVEKYPHLLDVKNKSRNTVLHAAAFGGNVQIVKLLIEKKMDVNVIDKYGDTILHKCGRSGNMEMCEYLVNNFSDLLEMRNNEGWTVLHSACFGGSVDIVTFLAKKELHINSLSNKGKSILHIACLTGKFEICVYLIENYPHLLDVKDKSNNTVLHDAVLGGNVQIVKLLIEKKMDVNAIDKYGDTILHKCGRSGNMEMCEYLVNNFSDLLEMRNNEGWTVLHSACCGGSVDIVTFLAKKELHINSLSNKGKSILHIACLTGKFEICVYLIENYPHLLDVKDKSNNTVLHDAVLGGNVQVVKLLIEKKMDVNVIDKYGDTILHKCGRSGNMEMCEYLVNNFSDLLEMRNNEGWTVLHSACCGGSVDIVTFLAKKELHINSLSNKGKSILHIACLTGKFEICVYLIENYPHLLDVKDKSNNTVLHDAVLGGNVQIVKRLIEKKMDVNAIDENGDTILHKCGRSGHMEMYEYLVNNFSDLLEIRNNHGIIDGQIYILCFCFFSFVFLFHQLPCQYILLIMYIIHCTCI